MGAAKRKTGFTAENAETAEVSILSAFRSVEARCIWFRDR